MATTINRKFSKKKKGNTVQKEYSSFLSVLEKQLKTTLRFHLTIFRM